MKPLKILIITFLLMTLCSSHIITASEYETETGYENWEILSNPRLRFEGSHVREGEFYLVNENDANKTLIEANKLTVRWENNSGIVKYFTKKDGSQLRIVKNQNNGDYVEIQAVSIEPQNVKLTKDCMAHRVPLEYEAFATGEIIKAGTYQVNKIGVGWIGILKDDGTNVWVNPNRDNEYEYVSGKFTFFENDIQTLSVNEINGIPIHTSYMIPKYNRVIRPGYSNVPLYVTIHNTSNSSNGADALAHAKIQYDRQNSPDVWLSWHFQVDDHSIYQSIPMDEVAWHAGDGSMMGNGNTIAIEICENNDGNYAQAERNAAYLTAQILFENNLPKDAVRKHMDWSGKNCPHNINEGTKGTMGWEAFLNLVSEIYDQLEEENRVIIPDEEWDEFIKKLGYKDEGNILYNIPVNTTVNELIDISKEADENKNIMIMNVNDEVVEEGLLKTGYQMKIISEDESETKEMIYILSVKGDVNGDGKILPTDYVLIKNHIMNTNARLKQAYAKAADYNEDGKILPTDYVQIKNYIMNQNNGG